MKTLNKMEYKQIKGGFNLIYFILKGLNRYEESVTHLNKLRKTQVVLIPL